MEDGSVDLDELKSSVGDDVLVISYRQGATPPAIQQPREPVSRREVNIKDRLLDLMIEFDEMGFAPTTVCPNGEQYAIDWREKVRKEFARLTAKNAALQKRLSELKGGNKQMTGREWLNSLPDEEFINYLVKQKDGICISDTNKEYTMRCIKMNDNCRKCSLEFLKSNYLGNPDS